MARVSRCIVEAVRDDLAGDAEDRQISIVVDGAAVGFAIQHDANHGAYSGNAIVNRFMGATLDLLGASSYLWHWKHNIFHHTYTNIEGMDHDLDAKPFGRLAPDQMHSPAHRFQHIYMWALYGFMLPKWHLVDDFQNALEARIDDNRIPRPRGWTLAQLLAGKALFFAWALVIPMLFHRWWVVLAFYGLTALLVDLLLAVVFQLAHCLEEADFPHLPEGAKRMAGGWARQQVQTTVDFARGNRLLTWPEKRGASPVLSARPGSCALPCSVSPAGARSSRRWRGEGVGVAYEMRQERRATTLVPPSAERGLCRPSGQPQRRQGWRGFRSSS